MILDYTATDEQVLATGLVSERVLELSKQWFMRPSNGKGFEMPDLDLQYAEAIMLARDKVSLAHLVVANPGKPVWFPPAVSEYTPYMGFVPNLT